MVIPFDRDSPNKDKDSNLFERIWANEMSGVLNQALAGYKRLVERKLEFKKPLGEIRHQTLASAGGQIRSRGSSTLVVSRTPNARAS